jgi:putative acyl-CoA dehydrogenase
LGEVRGDVVKPEARRFTERIAVALQASLLVRFSPAAITDGFLASRLDGDWDALSEHFRVAWMFIR